MRTHVSAKATRATSTGPATVALLALAFALGGCERGCLSGWLADRGVSTGPTPPGRGAGTSQDPAGVTLSAVDCPDGMARCGDGIVQVSRAYHYPEPCTSSPEACQCPWERAGDCPNGCAADGVEVDVPRSEAMQQLCAPGEADDVRAIFSQPPPVGATAAGCDEGFSCEKGLVVACGPPAVAIGACTKGCARDGQSIVDEESTGLSPMAAMSVLCKR